MNINAMSDKEIEQLYRNCLNAIIDEKPTKDRAAALIVDINAVWKSRLGAMLAGQYKPESPDIGVLKTMGYQVGHSGLATKSRWALLDHVMKGTLPFVGSPAHMHEWGEPYSLMRYRKLHRVLAGFRTSASQQDNLAKAHDDWSEDLDYIERTWKPNLTSRID